MIRDEEIFFARKAWCVEVRISHDFLCCNLCTLEAKLYWWSLWWFRNRTPRLCLFSISFISEWGIFRFQAPITEELAFRACAASLIREVFSPLFTIAVAPLPFSLSHFHHVFDDAKKGSDIWSAMRRRGSIYSYRNLLLFFIY